jgi:hypothetical protein
MPKLIHIFKFKIQNIQKQKDSWRIGLSKNLVIFYRVGLQASNQNETFFIHSILEEIFNLFQIVSFESYEKCGIIDNAYNVNRTKKVQILVFGGGGGKIS